MERLKKTFSRWVSYSDNQSYDIVKNNVIAMTDSIGLTRFYDYCVSKMQDMVKCPNIDNQLMKNYKRLKKKYLKSIIMKMMNQRPYISFFSEPPQVDYTHTRLHIVKSIDF